MGQVLLLVPPIVLTSLLARRLWHKRRVVIEHDLRYSTLEVWLAALTVTPAIAFCVLSHEFFLPLFALTSLLFVTAHLAGICIGKTCAELSLYPARPTQLHSAIGVVLGAACAAAFTFGFVYGGELLLAAI